jgi:hypothetical protein
MFYVGKRDSVGPCLGLPDTRYRKPTDPYDASPVLRPSQDPGLDGRQFCIAFQIDGNVLDFGTPEQ